VWAACSLLALAVMLAPVARAQCGDDDRVDECELVGGLCVSQVFLELKVGASIDAVLDRHPDLGLTLIDDITEWNFYLVELAVEVPPGEELHDVLDGLLDSLEEDPDVNETEPHRHLEAPEGVQISIPDLGDIHTPGDYVDQPASTAVGAGIAQTRYTGAGITVAILDTGMAFDHPLTSASIIRPGADSMGGDGTGEVQPNDLDDDGDLLIDESFHHATFVAGIVKLAAPNARILPVRVLETDGKGTSFSVAKGIFHAVHSGVEVINLSLGMLHDAKAVEAALEIAEDAGVVVVAAAGNRGLEIVAGEPPDDLECKSFPAYRDEVIAVAAVDANFVKADFSDYGVDVDLSAPGVDLLSAFGDVDIVPWSGSSFAAPFVSGAVALILERYPCLEPWEVRELLIQTVQPDNNPPELDGKMGAGVLDLDALTLALARDRCSMRAHETETGTVFTWSPVLDATTYDVARGDLANADANDLPPHDVDLGFLTCIADDSATTDTLTAPDPSVPAPSQVFFYLFRDDVVDPLDPEAGSYGLSDDDGQRVPSVGDCPGNP